MLEEIKSRYVFLKAFTFQSIPLISCITPGTIIIRIAVSLQKVRKIWIRALQLTLMLFRTITTAANKQTKLQKANPPGHKDILVLITQSLICKPAVLTLPVRVLGMRNLRHCPSPNESESAFQQNLQVILCILNFRSLTKTSKQNSSLFIVYVSKNGYLV